MGATTDGPDATQPPAICQHSGGGGGGGGRLEGVWGVLAAWLGGGGFPRWGGLRATHYYHMHLYSASSCYSGAQKHRWFDEKEAYTKKGGGGAIAAMPPNPLSLKTRGRGGLGGGGSHTRTGPSRPPWGFVMVGPGGRVPALHGYMAWRAQ